MKVLNNNKGLTLVEIVLAILILGMSGLMLATTFSSAMRILNRATLYKNISSSAAATVELEEEQDVIGGDTYYVGIAEENSTVTITYEKDGATKTTTMSGQYMYGSAEKADADAHLRYKEFLPSNYSYDIPANPVGD